MKSSPPSTPAGRSTIRVGLDRGSRSARAAATISAIAKRQLAQALAGGRGDREDPQPARRAGPRRPCRRCRGRRGRRSCSARPGGAGPRGRRSAASSVSMTSRSSTGLRPGSMRGGVDDVHQRGAALDVAQEVVAQAAALAGALDQAGDVGDGEGRLAGRDHAEVGHQGGERVVGDLGPGPRDRGDQAGLAGAGEADQPMSATTLSSRTTSSSSPGSPSRAKPGALRLEEARAALPRPPRPPCGDDQLGAGADQVGERRCRRRRVTTVPSGTGRTRSRAVAAVAVAAGARGRRARRGAWGCGGSRPGW